MHIETLKTFCDLVETGSFSEAGRLNFVSQSAVSQQLRALERRFDRKLIERRQGRPAVPTEAGRLLYTESKAILEQLRALDQKLRQSAEIMAGTLRVATVYSVGLHALPPFVKQFLRAHPQVNVRVEYVRTDGVYAACLDGTIDLGIVAQPLRRRQIEVIPLRPEVLVVVCSPEHPLARRREVPLARLAGEPFVAFDRGVPTRRVVDRLLKQHGASVQIVTEFDNIETIKRSVEAGLGVSILPENSVKNEVKLRTLVAISPSEGPLTRSVGIIVRKGRERSPTARAFIELLTAGMGG
ncbi:MAG: LysR family transcriptional regulator [Pseudomonadota bacterium]|nr:MAG: LysR family transcriptional regulator [Pseudomonadota bacterium]